MSTREDTSIEARLLRLAAMEEICPAYEAEVAAGMDASESDTDCVKCGGTGAYPLIQLPDGRTLQEKCQCIDSYQQCSECWNINRDLDNLGHVEKLYHADTCLYLSCQGRGWVLVGDAPHYETALWRLQVWFFEWYARQEPGYSNMMMFVARARLASAPEAILEDVEQVLGLTKPVTEEVG